MKKRSVKIAGHATSVTLEDEFWITLKELAAARGQSIAALIEEIDDARTTGLSSALRVFVLTELKSLLPAQNPLKNTK